MDSPWVVRGCWAFVGAATVAVILLIVTTFQQNNRQEAEQPKPTPTRSDTSEGRLVLIPDANPVEVNARQISAAQLVRMFVGVPENSEVEVAIDPADQTYVYVIVHSSHGSALLIKVTNLENTGIANGPTHMIAVR